MSKNHPTIYTLLTEECNLNCSHCDVKNDYSSRKYDKDKMIEKIVWFKEKYKDGWVLLFGGEPTLYPDRMMDMKPYSTAITSNLTIPLIIQHMEAMENLKINTSWNPKRFHTKELYNIWKQNLLLLDSMGKYPFLIVVLEKYLIDYPESLDELIKIVTTYRFNDILFEAEINLNNDQAFYDRASEWLYQLYLNHKSEFYNCTNFQSVDIIRKCGIKYTLMPNGELYNRCTHNKPFVDMLDKCLDCNYNVICRPCRLQKHCIFPKKLVNAIRKEKGLPVIEGD